ncbi:hypothetical protein C8R34_10129 [Nitrosomonas sp. Nm84]|uniref:hypothetical protein n=1 Tax=Nitrosomonas sp. Nm84 TaxID=200124 RepID=UPI000D755D2D|nr:hypothetical protein [Nitrosomonas sp. Nm84]PXW91120.1 hypothetical protein C8R34_10129 [Nitrosomonas sp. Nm84]
MPSSKKLTTVLCIYLLNMPLTQADDRLRIGSKITEFSSPVELCLPEVAVRGKTFNSVGLSHYLVVPPEDHSKTGDIFVGFRLKNQPNDIWLTDGSSWWAATDENIFPQKAFKVFDKLPPFAYLEVFNNLVDVSAFVGIGEIWAGYGLRLGEGATWWDSFEEMMRNQRFKILWEIGPNLDLSESQLPLTPQHGLYESQSTICLTVTRANEQANVPCCDTAKQ